MKKLIEQHEKMKEAGDDEDDIDKEQQKDSNEGSNEGSESSETKEIAYTTMRKIQEIQRDAEGAESKRNEEERSAQFKKEVKAFQAWKERNHQEIGDEGMFEEPKSTDKSQQTNVLQTDREFKT